MKKLYLIIVILSLFFLQSCRIDWGDMQGLGDINFSGPSFPSSSSYPYWEMATPAAGTATYSPMHTYRMRPAGTDTAIINWDRPSTPGLDSNIINSCMIVFKTFPTANRTYRVVAYPTSGSLSSDTTVYLSAKTAGNSLYKSTGTGGNVYVTVTLYSGKLSIVVPPIRMDHATLPPATFRGTLGEL